MSETTRVLCVGERVASPSRACGQAAWRGAPALCCVLARQFRLLPLLSVWFPAGPALLLREPVK